MNLNFFIEFFLIGLIVIGISNWGRKFTEKKINENFNKMAFITIYPLAHLIIGVLISMILGNQFILFFIGGSMSFAIITISFIEIYLMIKFKEFKERISTIRVHVLSAAIFFGGPIVIKNQYLPISHIYKYFQS